MELHLKMAGDATPRDIINLKQFIDRAAIDGMEGAELERAQPGNNTMGAGDVINSIKMIIEAAEKPLVELVKCLQRYVDNFRTKIIVPTKNGNITIEHGRSMKPDELKDLIRTIQENAN